MRPRGKQTKEIMQLGSAGATKAVDKWDPTLLFNLEFIPGLGKGILFLMSRITSML